MDFSPFKLDSKRVFEQSRTKHISPEEFKYQLPNQNIPEYAFIGRSNVGKSSLISALLNNKKIVRVSKEPGCTRTLHFYAFMKDNTKNIHDSPPSLYLVDLPGYGYAKISQSERKAWQGMIHNYLVARAQPVLRRTFVLIDSRRGMKDSDIEMISTLNQHAIPFQIILTKADLLKSQAALNAVLMSVFSVILAKVKGSMNVCLPIVHVVSSKTGGGLECLKENIMEISSYQWSDVSTVEDIEGGMTGMAGMVGVEGVEGEMVAVEGLTGIESIREGMRLETEGMVADMVERGEGSIDGMETEEGMVDGMKRGEYQQEEISPKVRSMKERKASASAIDRELDALYER